MTRKEEIRNASVAYNEKAGKLLVIGGDGILSEEEYLEFNKNPSFIAGAEWANKTMIDKAIKFFQSKSKHGMIEENINVFIDEYCKAMKGE